MCLQQHYITFVDLHNNLPTLHFSTKIPLTTNSLTTIPVLHYRGSAVRGMRCPVLSTPTERKSNIREKMGQNVHHSPLNSQRRIHTAIFQWFTKPAEYALLQKINENKISRLLGRKITYERSQALRHSLKIKNRLRKNQNNLQGKKTAKRGLVPDVKSGNQHEIKFENVLDLNAPSLSDFLINKHIILLAMLFVRMRMTKKQHNLFIGQEPTVTQDTRTNT